MSERGPNEGSQGVLAETRTDIDGFGRAIATHTTHGATANYLLKQTGEAIYDDISIPSQVTTKQRVEFDSSNWVTKHTYADGLGRVRRIESDTDGAGTLAVETLEYDDTGRLSDYYAPHPNYDQHRIRYHYEHDSVDRLTKVILPEAINDTDDHLDPSDLLDNAHVDFEYDGLSKTRSEHSNDAGLPSATRTVTDSFGRLIEVRELADISTDTWATTFYSYDGNDNLSMVTDAEGRTTRLEHDWLSRRTGIRRGKGPTWVYVYDANGNMTAEIAPYPNAPPGQAPLYSTTMAYDDLDRVTSRVTALRDQEKPRATELGIGMTLFTYDNCTGGLGRLCEVTLPYGGSTIRYEYDARGNVIAENRDINLPSGENINRSSSATYNAMNLPQLVVAPDGSAPPFKTQLLYSYDARGLPVGLSYVPNNSAVTLSAATLSRNLSGRPAFRTISPGQTTQNSPAALWKYDGHGRVIDIDVTAPGGISRTRQTIGYLNNGDVARMDHVLDGNRREFRYRYDERHQLLQVDDDQADYHALFQYRASGRLMRSNFSGAGVPVPRLVDYNYSSDTSQEVESVRALRIVATSNDYATYGYDGSGNVTRRFVDGDPSTSADDEAWDFVYAGEDWQREAVHTDQNGVTTTERYFYDHEGNRMVAARYTSGALDDAKFWMGPTELHFDHDGSGTLSLARSITRGALGQPVVRLERTNEAASPSVSQVYHSPLEHMLVSLDESGTVKAGFSYGPFGEVLDAVGPDVDVHERRFNGKDYDSVSELSYYGVRYYDKLSLTWTQGDPLYRFAPDAAFDEPRRMNLYAFSLNNPMRYVDPDGSGTLATYAEAGGGDIGGIRRHPMEHINKTADVEDEWGETEPSVSAQRTSKAPAYGKRWTSLALAHGPQLIEAAVGEGGGGIDEVLNNGPGTGSISGGPAGRPPSGAKAKAATTARGGTYKLRDPSTGQVRRTGKTNDLNRRQKEHGRGRDARDLDFEVDRRSDNEVARRGREQRIYDQHPEADLNKKRPISPNNPRRDEYLREGDTLE